MKADAVYKIVREVLQPLCKQLGFKRIGSLGWTAQVSASEHFTFWFQLSRDGWDDYAGSSFVVELQRAPSPTVGAWGKGTRRNRLGDLLSSEDRALITPMQNDVIRKLRKPPRTHFMYSLDADLIEHYESKFVPLETPFEGADLWLRYHDPVDVQRWAEFVRDRLPSILAEFAPDYAKSKGIEADPKNVPQTRPAAPAQSESDRAAAQAKFVEDLQSIAENLGATIDSTPEPHDAPDLEALIPADLTDPPLLRMSSTGTRWGDRSLSKLLKELGVRPRDARIATGIGKRGNGVLTVMLYALPGVSGDALTTAFEAFIGRRAGRGTWSSRSVGARAVRSYATANAFVTLRTSDCLVVEVVTATPVGADILDRLP